MSAPHQPTDATLDCLVLESSRESNQLGDVPSANWLHFLPSLALDQIVCLGCPSAKTLEALCQRANHVVVCADDTARRKWRSTLHSERCPNIEWLDSAATSQPSIDKASCDLIYVSDEAHLARLNRNGLLREEVGRWLRDDGWIYLEYASLRWGQHGWRNQLSRQFGGLQEVWAAPRSGESLVFAGKSDNHMIRRIANIAASKLSITTQVAKRLIAKTKQLNPPKMPSASTVGTPQKRKSKSSVRSVLRQLARHALGRAEVAEDTFRRICTPTWMPHRTGCVIGRNARELVSGPPKYIRQIASESGLDLDGYGWGLIADADYSSRKLLFLLSDPGSHSPRYIVKLCRESRFNARLANESQALHKLALLPFTASGAVPRVVFDGEHAGLRLVGETFLDGTPFLSHTTRQIDCPYANNVILWLTDLAYLSREHRIAAPQMAAGLTQLFHRFQQIYDPPSHVVTCLEQQLQIIDGYRNSIPLVFQHGDPGCWNLMVTNNEQIVFLDWESAESQGMPLWDLLYFLRSFCGVVDPKRGDGGLTLNDAIAGSHPLTKTINEKVQRYCHRIGLGTELIEPLYHLCWVHRAVKHASRLSAEKLQQGRYYRLVAAACEGRQLPNAGSHGVSREASVTR